jgi:hypothetical protein
VAEFFAAEAAHLEAALRPAVVAHLSLVDQARTPDEVLRQLVADHVERARTELTRVAEAADPARLEELVDRVVSDWELQAPARVADELLRQEEDDDAKRCA